MKKVIHYFLFLILHHSIVFSENTSNSQKQAENLVAYVQMCIVKAENLQSNLNPEVFMIQGMSSPKVRHFLNNLCSMPNTHYLEIGCWKGSTFIASLCGNSKTVSSAVAIDNWSEWGGPREEFVSNCNKFLTNNNYILCENDSFKINQKELCTQPVNVYFYDGWHEALQQELAFTYYNEIFDDVFVAVIDDWNHPPVPEGTRAAFEKLGYRILFEQVLPARWNGDVENWWNGLYVAVIRKS